MAGHGERDDRETWDPFVIFEDGVFYMWYGSTTLSGGERDIQVGLVVSGTAAV